MTTETRDEDFATIAWMIREGSSSWVGPTPRARNARWAARWAAGTPRRPPALATKRRLPGLVFTAVVFFTVVAVAAAITPGGILSMSRSVSTVIGQKLGAPATSVTVNTSGSHRPAETTRPTPVTQPAVSPSLGTGPVVSSPTPAPVESGDDHGGGSPNSGRGSSGGGGGPGPG